jgi:hypothetical protein
MKCPKCGYISFDSNQVCPKCNKDISAEQAKLNLPAFKPGPPALLGALIGEADESDMGMVLDHAADGETSDEGIRIADEASASGGEETGFDDSDELEITLEPDEAGDEDMMEPLEEPLIAGDSETPMAEAADSLEESLSDFEFESSAAEEAVPETPEGPEGPAGSAQAEPDASTAAKIEDLTLDADEGGPTASLELGSEEGEELSIELGELSVEEPPAADDARDAASEPVLEDSEVTLEAPPAAQNEETPEADGVAAKGPEQGETVLSLDELKINDTGELEINTDFNAAAETENAASVQEESSGPPVTAASPAGRTPEDVVELEDLTLDELTLDQSEMSEPEPQEQANDPGVETIDFEELPLDAGVFGDSNNSTDEEGTIDLENLDLELDLGELERK